MGVGGVKFEDTVFVTGQEPEPVTVEAAFFSGIFGSEY
jgi:hypothetical protein